MNFIYIAKKNDDGLNLVTHGKAVVSQEHKTYILYTHARTYACALIHMRVRSTPLLHDRGDLLQKKNKKINAKKRMIGWFLQKKRKKNVLKSKSVYIFKKEPS